MTLVFVFLMLVAGLLAGIAVRAAFASARAGRGMLAWVATGLAATLVFTCWAGRALLGEALGLSLDVADWLLLLVGLGVGLVVGEIALRLGETGKLRTNLAETGVLRAWPLLVLVGAVAVVPAFGVGAWTGLPPGPTPSPVESTTTSIDITPTPIHIAPAPTRLACEPLTGEARLSGRASRGPRFPVTVSWAAAGGCAPVSGALTAQLLRGQTWTTYRTWQVQGTTASVTDGGPLSSAPCFVRYQLRLQDRAKGTVAGQTGRIQVCPVQVE